MSKLNRYTKLKTIFDEATESANKLKGAIDEQLKMIKKEYGCNNIKEAIKLNQKLSKQEQTQAQVFDQAVQQLEDEHGEELGNEFD